jgi:hypothetical protein
MRFTKSELKTLIKEEVVRRKKIEDLEAEKTRITEELGLALEECGMEEEERLAEEGGWPKKLKTGRFTSYCKSMGYEGANISCAKEAMKSDDASVRGMASFYMNTVKPKGKTASALEEKSSGRIRKK